jgi:hypothetical protein
MINELLQPGQQDERIIGGDTNKRDINEPTRITVVGMENAKGITNSSAVYAYVEATETFGLQVNGQEIPLEKITETNSTRYRYGNANNWPIIITPGQVAGAR